MMVAMMMPQMSLANNNNQDNYKQAAQALSEALYKETGLDKKVKKLEKKYINKDLKKYGGYTILIADIVVNQRVQYEWKF
jgi:hypothetical protein